MLSFIVPAYNEEQLIAGTLREILTAARASQEDYELIVVDDASTDWTAQIALAEGATVLAVNNRQIAATRNAGARASQGDILFFVDADTQINERVVGAALEKLRRGAVGGGCLCRFTGPIPVYAHLMMFICQIGMRIVRLSAGMCMFATREAFLATGGFDESLFGGEDAAMCMALRKQGRFVVLPQRVLTSGRRTRTVSGLEILKVLALGALLGKRAFQDRRGLAKLWYDESRSDPGIVPSNWTVRLSNSLALLLLGAVAIGPLFWIPLPESFLEGPLDSLRSVRQSLMALLGLLFWPVSLLLARLILKERAWTARITTGLVAVFTLWVASAATLYWIRLIFSGLTGLSN
jgi:glycosyltransferase involved in cell wall biosynthesis